MTVDLQEQCELGQQHLMRMEYIQAERLLAEAEEHAWKRRDWDTLARLYMPLQEARRQRRQRCGEGVVCLDPAPESEADAITPRHVVENFPAGQLLVGGWGSIEPALGVRRLAAELELYVETFLAAVYPLAEGNAIVIAPLEETVLPAGRFGSIGDLESKVRPGCLVMRDRDLPAGTRKGSAQTYAQVMALWERLHRPFLDEADAQPDPIRRIGAYRRAIRVDYACELAHQGLAEAAHELARQT